MKLNEYLPVLMSLTILLKYLYKISYLSKYISMVTTIICVFLWRPDILKELCNVLYESVLKSYFLIKYWIF
jgi:hypothetical protein